MIAIGKQFVGLLMEILKNGSAICKAMPQEIIANCKQLARESKANAWWVHRKETEATTV